MFQGFVTFGRAPLPFKEIHTGAQTECQIGSTVPYTMEKFYCSYKTTQSKRFLYTGISFTVII